MLPTVDNDKFVCVFVLLNVNDDVIINVLFYLTNIFGAQLKRGVDFACCPKKYFFVPSFVQKFTFIN